MIDTTTPEALNDLRQQVLAGKEFSVEDYRDIIQARRALRVGAIAAAAPKVTARAAASAAAKPRSLAEVLAEAARIKREQK